MQRFNALAAGRANKMISNESQQTTRAPSCAELSEWSYLIFPRWTGSSLTVTFICSPGAAEMRVRCFTRVDSWSTRSSGRYLATERTVRVSVRMQNKYVRSIKKVIFLLYNLKKTFHPRVRYFQITQSHYPLTHPIRFNGVGSAESAHSWRL